MNDQQYLKDRIAKTKTLIEAWEDAQIALAGANGTMSYTIDTGQTKQTVTRFDLKKIQETLDTLYNRLAVFETRLNGCGSNYGRGCW